MNEINEVQKYLSADAKLSLRQDFTYMYVNKMHECGIPKEKISEVFGLPVYSVDCLLFVGGN